MRSWTEHVARWIWYQILMGSRRSRNRAQLLKLFNKIPPEARGRIRRQLSRQERFARRFAVPMLKVALTLASCSIIFALALLTATYLQEMGWVQSPYAK